METLEQKLDRELSEIPKEELIQKCCNILSDICNGGKKFVMTVPPSKNCSDMLLAELISRYRENK